MSKNPFLLSLMENLEFLLDNFEKIKTTPEYYFCPVPDSWLGAAYISRGRSELYLGELLSLWKNGDWLGLCPECGDTVFLTNAGGSPLSGSGSAWGICKDCKKMVYGIKPFGKYFRQIVKLPFIVLPEGLVMLSLTNVLEELRS
ncbi:MAG: hypothetical protein PF518_10170 [Spirochaetaceae bacterium]|jgi:hypothetical protein|nr:hypothetical protein [Spirochaetaceae bacterium]